MRKTVSLCLAVIMLFSTLITANAVQTNQEQSQDDTVTYYFLAPDNYFKLDAGAANTDVGCYYWDAGGNGDWPGQAAVAAPEVHPNAFKISVPGNDDVATIIFNAFVDVGSPADPALAAVAHQTENINVEAQNYDGYIYVLAQDKNHQSVNEFSGAVTTSGDWFTLDEFRSSDNYKTYGFDKETMYHEGDIVTVDFMLGGVDSVGSLSARIDYSTDYLEKVSVSKKEVQNSKVVYNDTVAGQISVGAVFDPYGETHDYADEKISIVTAKFKALKDFNEEDLGLSKFVTILVQVTDNGQRTTVLAKKSESETVYTDMKISVECTHNADTDTDTNSDSDSDFDSDSDTEPNSDTDTDKEVTPTPIKKLKVGDIDNDSKITSGDSLMVLRHSVKLDTLSPEQQEAADVNKDNKIDSSDALYILRKSVKYSDEGTYFED